VSGLDNIDTNESYIYIANHTHLLDIPILIKSIKTDNIHFVYRKSLQKVPVLGLALKKSPFIPIIRESNKNAMDSINQATELLKTRSIIMFPEGTRSDDGITKKFKRGAFLLAASTNKKIVPISISYPLPIPDSNDFSYSDLKNLNLKKIYVQINNPIESIPVDRSEQNLFIDDIQKLIAHQVQSNKNKLR
jgi:1-acyl-sn-glycerol-3-phosphate acyltransferase